MDGQVLGKNWWISRMDKRVLWVLHEVKQVPGVDAEILKRGGGGPLYFGHHGCPAKKILDFRWSKKVEITSETISKFLVKYFYQYFQIFSIFIYMMKSFQFFKSYKRFDKERKKQSMDFEPRKPWKYKKLWRLRPVIKKKV